MDFNKSEEKHLKKTKLKKRKTTVADQENCCVDDLIPTKKTKRSQTEQAVTLEPESDPSGGSKKRNKDKKKRKKEERVNVESTENQPVKKKKKRQVCDNKHEEIHQDLSIDGKKQRKKDKGNSEKLLFDNGSATIDDNMDNEKVSGKLKKAKNKAGHTEETQRQRKEKKSRKENSLSVNDPEQNEEKNTADEAEVTTQEWGEATAAGGSECDKVETTKKKKKAKRKCDATEQSEDCKNTSEVNNQENDNVLDKSDINPEKVHKEKKKKKSDGKGEKRKAKITEETKEQFLTHGENKEDVSEETVTVVKSKKINKKKRQKYNKERLIEGNEIREESETVAVSGERSKKNGLKKEKTKKKEKVEDNVLHDEALKKKKEISQDKEDTLFIENEGKPKSEKKAKKKRKTEEKVEEPPKSVHVDVTTSNQTCKASQPETPVKTLDLGQWTTAEFNNSQQQHKFLSLMGAFKKGFKAAAPDKGKSNMALGKEAQQQLQQGLLGQFEHAHSRTMNFNNRGAGLGFTPPSNKKFSIDINTRRSVHFDP